MNKFINFVRDGESKLPPGFRFQPTDEEIVFQYLAPKIFSYPLPASVIPEINSTISTFDPWELPGNMEQDKYLFAKKGVNNRLMMRGSCGLWKCISLDKVIVCSKRLMPIVGLKKTLVFLYKGKHPTKWFMHLFCIALIPPNSNIHHHKQGSFVQIGKWSLCHVFLKRRSMIKQRINYETTESSDADSSSSSASSSDSSAFSEVSSSGSETN